MQSLPVGALAEIVYYLGYEQLDKIYSDLRKPLESRELLTFVSNKRGYKKVAENFYDYSLLILYEERGVLPQLSEIEEYLFLVKYEILELDLVVAQQFSGFDSPVVEYILKKGLSTNIKMDYIQHELYKQRKIPLNQCSDIVKAIVYIKERLHQKLVGIVDDLLPILNVPVEYYENETIKICSTFEYLTYMSGYYNITTLYELLPKTDPLMLMTGYMHGGHMDQVVSMQDYKFYIHNLVLTNYTNISPNAYERFLRMGIDEDSKYYLPPGSLLERIIKDDEEQIPQFVFSYIHRGELRMLYYLTMTIPKHEDIILSLFRLVKPHRVDNRIKKWLKV